MNRLAGSDVQHIKIPSEVLARQTLRGDVGDLNDVGRPDGGGSSNKGCKENWREIHFAERELVKGFKDVRVNALRE